MNDKVIVLLRIGVAFSFFYAAISGFIEPNAWIGFIPQFVGSIIPAETILLVFGVVEILVALALLFMRNPFYPAVLSALMLSSIIVFNFSQMDLLFRDIPIILMAVALAIHFKNQRPEKDLESINY